MIETSTALAWWFFGLFHQGNFGFSRRRAPVVTGPITHSSGDAVVAIAGEHHARHNRTLRRRHDNVPDVATTYPKRRRLPPHYSSGSGRAARVHKNRTTMTGVINPVSRRIWGFPFPFPSSAAAVSRSAPLSSGPSTEDIWAGGGISAGDAAVGGNLVGHCY